MEEKTRLFPVIARNNRPLKQLSDNLYKLLQSHLWLKVLVAMAAGILTGIALGPSAGWVSPDTGAVIGSWLAFPGHLFLAVIQMIVIPLVFASIIRGLAAGENLNSFDGWDCWWWATLLSPPCLPPVSACGLPT